MHPYRSAERRQASEPLPLDVYTASTVAILSALLGATGAATFVLSIFDVGEACGTLSLLSFWALLVLFVRGDW